MENQSGYIRSVRMLLCFNIKKIEPERRYFHSFQMIHTLSVSVFFFLLGFLIKMKCQDFEKKRKTNRLMTQRFNSKVCVDVVSIVNARWTNKNYLLKYSFSDQ